MILPTIGEVYAAAEMIIKVKEPEELEYKMVRKDQLVLSFFHFASNRKLTHAMMDSGATHNFIRENAMQRLGLLPKPMQTQPIFIPTPKRFVMLDIMTSLLTMVKIIIMLLFFMQIFHRI